MTDLSLPPIDFAVLMDRLSDPDSDLDHLLGYMIEVPVPGRMGPELEPNPALVLNIPPRVEGGFLVSLANGFMRTRRHRQYRKRIAAGWTGPRIVSEGDSWFQYPTRLQDTIDHLMKSNAILSLGAAGDELKDIQNQREILRHIQNEGAKALLLSAGGNDLFDNGQLGRLVEDPFPGATGEDLVGETFQAFLRTMVPKYLSLFRRVHRAFPHVHMLIHGYGPAFPRNGAWIEKPLTDRGVPKSVQHDVVKLILRRFNDSLAGLAKRAEFHGKLAHIDVTHIGTKPGDWHDEIHLNGPNYKKVADVFQAELDKRLAGAAPESGIPAAATSSAVTEAAARLAALDQGTLLRELDLRVNLVDLDPTAADEADLPLLSAAQPATELGFQTICTATERLIRPWLDNLRDVLCGGAGPDNLLEKAVVDGLGKGKGALSGAIAGWLISGPFGVPAAVATALAAWLAGEALRLGKTKLCATYAPVSPPVLEGVVEAAVPTMADARAMFAGRDGVPGFDAAFVAQRKALMEEVVRKDAVEEPTVPVDENGMKAFMAFSGSVFEMLGGETDDAPVDTGFLSMAEALIEIDGTRPALYVRDGTVDVNDPKLERSTFQDQVIEHLPDIERQIAATGRVLQGFDRSPDRVFGSAWMLDGGRAATAQHVVEFMAVRFGPNWFLNGNFFVDFAVEADRPTGQGPIFRVEGVEGTGPNRIEGRVNPAQLDVAVLKLVPVGGQAFPDPVPLATLTDEAEMLADARPWFYNVGHPGAPTGGWLVDAEDNDPNTLARSVLHALIGRQFGVKRFSPGLLKSRPTALGQPGMFDAAQPFGGSVFLHDATTLGGSSGSPLMMPGKNGMVTAGLHFAGLFGTQNYAHWVPAIQEPLT
jgi:hypothetical protein